MTIDNVRGIIWDLDGTLLDSFGIFEQVIAEVVAESGHAMPSHEFMLHNFHGSLEETIQRILGIESASELAGVVNSFLEKQIRHYDGDLGAHLFNDAAMLAQQAARQGVHQLLVTNRFHGGHGAASPKFIVAATLLADCIHEVYPGDEVAYRKPDKRSVGTWLERCGLEPGEVVVIGDQFVDAQLAINLGARAILIDRNGGIPHLDTIALHDKDDLLVVGSLETINFSSAGATTGNNPS